ncbi:hypothetical protein [Burkholderia sp. BCC0097]|uniref:hypothetical protein n=1 Tax=Burkholderia sp. BCC0097 TaxID=2676289 RepID=UPI00158F401D|nr:hypothetical protein [Burkholderia sp. BCC0097]
MEKEVKIKLIIKAMACTGILAVITNLWIMAILLDKHFHYPLIVTNILFSPLKLWGAI